MLVLLGLALLCACAHKKKPKRRTVAPGPVVKSVEVEGNEAIEDKVIIEHLNLRPTKFLQIGGVFYYVPGLEEIDRERLVELYAAHGRFGAQVPVAEVEVETKGNVTRWERRAARRKAAGRKPPPPLPQHAHARFEVLEGPATKVTKVTLVSDRPFPLRDANKKKLGETELRSDLGPKTGDVLNAETMNDAARTIENRLRTRGFAFAKVKVDAQVNRDTREARVRFDVAPGEAVKVRSVDIVGLDRVPEDLVAREWKFAIDEPYSPKLAERVESAVYGLSVFSAVTVEVQPLENGEAGSAKLIVRVHEAKLQRVKWGVRIGVDPVRWEQIGVFNYRHESLGGRLTRMNLKIEAGYAELPNFWNARQHGPVGLVELTFRKKGWLEPQLVWTEAPSFELGIWDGYQFYSVRNRIGVERFFSRYFELGLTYNNRFTDFFNITEDFVSDSTTLGLDFRDPFFVSYLGLEAVVHLVDNIVSPQNGVRLRVNYDVANRYLGSQFNFHRVGVALTGYWRVHDRFKLLARARTGFLVPYGKDDVRGVPIDMRYYLGGGYTVRGWPLRQLSPRLPSNTDIPIGGYTEVLANLEAQVRVWKKLWVAAFGDMGDVRAGVAEFDPRGWQFTTGGGLRYGTPVGTIRLDFGWRLTRDDARFPIEATLFEGDQNFAIHIAIGEAF